jgi:hypothetical protein
MILATLNHSNINLTFLLVSFLNLVLFPQSKQNWQKDNTLLAYHILLKI